MKMNKNILYYEHKKNKLSEKYENIYLYKDIPFPYINLIYPQYEHRILENSKIAKEDWDNLKLLTETYITLIYKNFQICSLDVFMYWVAIVYRDYIPKNLSIINKERK